MEQKYKNGIDFVKLIRRELTGIVADSWQDKETKNPLKKAGIKVLRRGFARKLGDNYLEISVAMFSEFRIVFLMQQLVTRLAPKGFQVRFVDYANSDVELGLMAFSRLDNPKRATLLKIVDRR